ncbi:LLM class F420-dependent oxidoreductase [Frankia sp. CNm7]|uniref:LLM class F420-dependent oxidoreductase n=1 Tax=Frankia nepalensis TaxID=1836974 RepID=A0A937RQG8_9ACTN|nr:LLM class F420-dependent oxidoreductase [Frankia nepalensis]MBL7498935.1 LLM class F420-dependent oxidoreductase [Frankia nepalensis]MBL7511268.1 LLM class F420-dependent oxidoreductase [Frankia nepalensis]MBL7520558.1 LLM class F420-dependent oxidoreductase [Frankia nepalensis]MBL7630788.1 LLM class F420-dependent oxidoreductase [Frankia nepalensis]
MELGVSGLNAKATVGPEATVRLARLAEELGYRSWWAGEHVVLPSPRVPSSPMEATDPILDPLLHLAYVAAVTRRLELGTGIVILPQRNPLVLAKQVASLDVLSGGRVLLGVGAGYLEPEMTAIGVPMAGRGRRTDEYLDAMTSLWLDSQPAYDGQYVAFANIDAHPRPVRPGGPRIVIGGHSQAAYRRAVARGHGWFGNGTAADLVTHLSGLAAAATEVERPARLGRLETIYMQLDPVEVTAAAARRYAELGVDRLLVYPLPIESEGDVAAFLERHASLPH